MSMPSVVALKDQANRLVAYLGDKHRFKLKLSSALEAMAAIHKQRDWNTLQALAAAAEAPAPAVAADAQFPVAWGAQGQPLNVNRADWLRHTLATGGSSQDRRAWCLQQLYAQVARGGSGVFVHAFGGLLPADELSERLTVLDLGAAGGPEYNALRGLDPDEVAAMLVPVLYSGDASPGADYQKQLANYTITVLVGALQESQEPITLGGLVGLLSARSGEAVQRLGECCPAGAARQQLGVFLDQYRSKDGGLRGNFGELAGRLAMLQATPFARRILSSNPQAPGLLDLIAGPRCVVVELDQQAPIRDVARQGAVLLAVIRALASRRASLPLASRGGVPQTVLLCEVQAYLQLSVTRLVEHGRSMGMSMLLTAPSETALAATSVGYVILANCWNRLHLGGLAKAQAVVLLERLTAEHPVLVSPTTVQF